ncbi:MAG: hypothetical protein K2M12_03140 [Muribaculaceae bacterium]|nr:hypothetical protein [Muribaculaceae bacterium]
MTYIIPTAGETHRVIGSRTVAMIACAAALLAAAFFVPVGLWVVCLACALPVALA